MLIKMLEGYASKILCLPTIKWVGGELLKLVSYKRNKNRLGLTQAIAC
jgi:hypothetical protein